MSKVVLQIAEGLRERKQISPKQRCNSVGQVIEKKQGVNDSKNTGISNHSFYFNHGRSGMCYFKRVRNCSSPTRNNEGHFNVSKFLAVSKVLAIFGWCT